MTRGNIVVPGDEFNSLASGDGGAAEVLHAGQLSKRLLLLRAVVDRTAERRPSLYQVQGLDQALRVLADARRTRPSEVNRIIMQPRVGAWAEHCLRLLAADDLPVTAGASSGPQIPPRQVLVDHDLGELATLAATAAAVANLDFELQLPDKRTVALPGYGLAAIGWQPHSLRVRGRSGTPEIEISDDDGCLRVRPSDPRQSAEWQPIRRLCAESHGLRLDVAIDDIDPFRDPHGLGADDRLSVAEADLWQTRLVDTWDLLAGQHPVAAAAMARNIACLVPLRSTSEASNFSGSSADAFGSICLTRPPDELAFASALVHEFQHTKLSALLDLVPLHLRRDASMFYAPWRADARPLRGLLQGTYAYLGLTGLMAVERGRGTPERRRYAEFEFARFREQIWSTAAAVADSDALTDSGRKFIAAMRGRIAEFRRVRVATESARRAKQANSDNEASWRLSNLVCYEETIAGHAAAFCSGQAMPVTTEGIGYDVERTTTRPPSNPRLALTYLVLQDPNPATRSQYLRGPRTRHEPTEADVQLVAFEAPTRALDLYRSSIQNDPGRLDQWAGITVACRLVRHDGTYPLVARPEVVQQVHQEVLRRTGHSVDPISLADWLSGGGGRRSRITYNGDGSKTKSTLVPETASTTSG